ncbi:hypothetical protein ACEWY4_007570 [Coilia grayii]|uniref:Zinc finger CCHC domain-containing protein 7 n=1 Tax=Coilia grayii TaxID=363190 RepID=A0ABD1KH18_9TELE
MPLPPNASVIDNQDKGLWKISQRDQMAQIANKTPGDSRPARRYYTEKNVVCNNCNYTGHLSKNCPRPQKVNHCLHCGHPGHVYRDCPYIYCRNCGLPGHTHDSCLEQSYRFKQCHRCNMKGHFRDACPQIWRQFHLTTHTGPLCKPTNHHAQRTPPYCYNCSQKGHFGFECCQQQMFSRTYPSLPFIKYYDKPVDFKHRDHHLQKKAKDMAEAGLLPLHLAYQTEPAEDFLQPHKNQKTHHQSFQHNNPKHKNKFQHKNLQQGSSRHINQQRGSTYSKNYHKKTQNIKSPHSSSTQPCLKKNTIPQHTNATKKQHNRKRRATSSKILVNDNEDFPRGMDLKKLDESKQCRGSLV